MRIAPAGTVTFFFTDIEGSTKRWEQHPDAMNVALRHHDALLRQAIEGHQGYVFKTVGDAFCATFDSAAHACAAALVAQHAIENETWSVLGQMRVRMALHSGVAEVRGDDYFGQPVNRVARLLAAAHGGQILISAATAELVRDVLPSGSRMRDLGEHHLKDLARPEHIFQLIIPDLDTDFPPLRTLDTHPNNLPIQPTPLIGREREIEGIKVLLLDEGTRLLTLTGPGGSGKTRLSMQVAADLIDEFVDGVFLVALAPLADPAQVAPALAQSLMLSEVSDRPLMDDLKAYLREKRILLLFDNFEHVSSAAPLLAELVATAPSLKVLVTSRETLHLRGEKEYPVPPLALPRRTLRPSPEFLSQYEAVRLFIERAQAVRPGFSVTNENAPAVAAICHRLDGLPLAIELAAARVKVLSPQALLPRLELRLLTGGARDLPERQQTLRSAIAWSYDLLSEEERRLFRCLSVFVGGCTFEAAEAVYAASGEARLDVLDGLTSLVDKNLLRQEEQPNSEPYFVMLETIRDYGLECLAADPMAESVQRCHARYYYELVEQAEPQLWGPELDAWLDRLEKGHDNLLASLRWLTVHDETKALWLTAAIWRFWTIRGPVGEGREWLTEVIARSAGTPASVQAKAFLSAGLLALHQVAYAEARSYFEQSLALFRDLTDRRGMAWSLVGLGAALSEQGVDPSAHIHAEQGLELFRELGDRAGIAWSLIKLGDLTWERGDDEAARSMYMESLSVARVLQDACGVATSLFSLSRVALGLGDTVGARLFLEECLIMNREIQDVSGTSNALTALAFLVRAQGEQGIPAALAFYEQALAIARDAHDRLVEASVLRNIGIVSVDSGEIIKGLEFYRQAQAIEREIDNRDGEALTLGFMGDGYERLGELQSALAVYRQALAIQEELQPHEAVVQKVSLATKAINIRERAESLLRHLNRPEDADGPTD